MTHGQLYDAFYGSDPEPVVGFITYLCGLYDLPCPGSFLDMGCGPGRLIAPLSEKGWKVTAYEPDGDYAATATEVIRHVPEGRFRQAGFLDLDEEEAYDLMAAVGGPYYCVVEASDRREAVARCYRALRPGGVLFLNLSHFLGILQNYREPPTLRAEIDGVTVTRTARHEFDYHLGIMTHHDHFSWLEPSGEKRSAEKTYRMAMVSYPEVALFLEDAGFIEVRTFNSFADRAPSPLSGKRIIVLARRGQRS